MAKGKKRKIFVLDTSVILHDHNSILNFKEHDVAIPIVVLEELDNFKKGNDTKNYEAREFIRNIDKLSKDFTLQDWIPLVAGDSNKGKFKIVMFKEKLKVDAVKVYRDNKADHWILNAAISLQETEPKANVVLVTKDINLRLKAKALNIQAEDYETGKIDREDLQHYSGKETINDVDSKIINELYTQGSLPIDDLGTKISWSPNQFYTIKDEGKSSAIAFYNANERTIEKVEKRYVYGIKPRNAEQAFAVHALLNPDIKLVSMQGVAGTGKTLLALASAIEQHNLYRQIILARPIIPLSNRDIGYLPGSADDKVNPYMQPLFDNLLVIKDQFGKNEKKGKKIEELEQDGALKITALAFIRGRSFANTIFIVDEAQNLTPHEVKTIITRAGENTKIIFTGDVHQIDTPYLDEESNGLTYLIDRLKGSKLYAHITLEKGERSELANLANDLL